MAILTVGSGEQFSTLAAAVAASHDGDTIDVRAGTYVNDFANITHRLTIVGIGGIAHFVAAGEIPNGKGILVSHADLTVENLEFSGAQVADNNGAGIRWQGGNLSVENCYFHDNQEGILGSDIAGATATISHSEFARNGAGDGYSHGVYIGAVARLDISDSYFFETNVGNQIQSRAQETLVERSVIDDGNSTSSYSINLPNGGTGIIRDNTIIQGPNGENRTIINFGGAAQQNPNPSLVIEHNIIENFGSPGIGLHNRTGIVAQLDNNEFYHLQTVVEGSASQSGDMNLVQPIVPKTSGLYLGATQNVSSAGAADPPGPVSTPTHQSTPGFALTAAQIERLWGGDISHGELTALKTALDGIAGRTANGGINVVHFTGPNQGGNATAGHDLFVFDTLSQYNDVGHGFDPSQDLLLLRNGARSFSDAAAQHVSFIGNGTSTEIVVDANTNHGHTIITLDHVLPSSLAFGHNVFV
ncbi:MAG TPA: right-handed parallel beta-helix repeat-containing protein [Stellaceae bacterium]|nr:right-handed parallel beta-helix repeat-containing protein [Stellaceae bacterium]